MSQDTTKLTIVIPSKLHRKLKTYAASKTMSMAQVAVMAFEAFFRELNGGGK